MKKILIAIAAIAATWLIGYYVGQKHPRVVTIMSQVDTVYSFDTVHHSKLQLASKTYKLEVPEVMKVFVLIPVEKTDTVIKENKVYVAMEREWRYTETEDVQIWHSGIDSTIDSLNVFRRDVVISKTETITQTATNRNTLALGFEMQYNGYASMPIYLEYSYLLHKNLEMFANISYDLPTKQMGVGMGLQIQFGW